ncbi:MAG TPA: YcaO-like family protein [Casimicrobiaceae bacterium]|jgi:YcaO-like protein with predicted kinase domain|nr:YcaO-like family protein [Casimicrobiaceae bacterium]
MPDANAHAAAIDLGGTIRASQVDATLAKVRKIFRAVGITRVGNVTGLDHIGVPTWMVVRPLAKSLTVSQGKGLTHLLAQASGVMESIELYHAENFAPSGQMKSLRAAMRDASFANPLLLPIRPAVTIHEDSQTEWISGTDIFSAAERWVPRDCVNLDSMSESEHPRLFVASSNGLASGNTMSEAILHAVCELIERDQVSLWLARQQFELHAPNTRLRLDSVSDESCKWLIDKCADAGVRIAAWHVTQTIPVPCFMCRAFDSQGQTFYPQRASGFGCHPYRRVALARAITEALQSRLTHIAGGRDDVFWSHYKDAIRIDNAAGASWARNLEGEPEDIDFDDRPEAPQLHTIEELLDWVLTALQAEGLSQVIVVDLTQDHLGIPVVHVTVPGLEGLFGKPGYTPGPRMQSLLRHHFDS